MKGMEHQLDFPDPASVLFLSASKSVKTIKQSNKKSPNLSARNPSVSLRQNRSNLSNRNPVAII
jgi:hypothetical protein